MVLEAGMSRVSRGTSIPLNSSAGRDLTGRSAGAYFDGLGDLADGHALVADGVEHCAGGSLLDG